jgi:hypothetical protein
MKNVALFCAAALSSMLFPTACKCGRSASLEPATASNPAPAPPPATAAPPPPSAPEKKGVALDSPYAPRAHVYRGQLHAHTTNSDGRQPPAAVVAAYRAAKYDFVAVTDHNFNTPDPKVPGILFVPGVENDHTCLHENRIGATTVAPGARLPQDVVDQARREGSFVQINHPDWPGRYPQNPCWSDAALLAMRDYDAIEAWNSSNDAWNQDAETRVDMLLTNGRRAFLTAVDDCHDVSAAYCMTASVNVFADALTRDGVLAALKSGNFYASFGATISTMTVADAKVVVETPVRSDVEFIVKGGAVAKTVTAATTASYDARGDEQYVRVRVTRVADRRKAWSNPIYVSPAE